MTSNTVPPPEITALMGRCLEARAEWAHVTRDQDEDPPTATRADTVAARSAYDALRAELDRAIAALAEDAQRYRFVRDELRVRRERMMSGKERPCLVMGDYALPHDAATGRDVAVDSAIDAEIVARSTPSEARHEPQQQQN